MTPKFPHPLLIIVSFILLAGLATYLLPKGEYERRLDPATNRQAVVPGSYQFIDVPPLPPFDILVAIPRGIVAGGEVIALIFIVGACIYVIEKTGALTEGMLLLTQRLRGRDEIMLLLMGLFFLVGGALEGMEEEVIPLIPVMILLTRRLGYDALVMISVSYGASVIGATYSPTNPFGAVTAQKIAGIPFLTAGGYQVFIMILAFVLWMVMILRYSNKNRQPKHEASESSAIISATNNQQPETSNHLSARMGLILFLVAAAFSILIYGLISLGWGFNEISAEFFFLAIMVGLIGKLGLHGTFTTYVEGLREMTFAALIVGFAHGISLVLTDGKVLDTIIHGLFIPMEGLPPLLSAIGMMCSQFLLHIVVPSYAGQAVLTIPILIPLSDLIGLSREMCVLAFQYGAILMNMISPTNGALMAILVLSGLTYDKWFVYVGKRVLVMLGFSAMALVLAGLMGIR